MAQLFHLVEQIERCLRLARDSTDPVLRDSLLKLADEYAARAGEAANGSEDGSKNDDAAVWHAGSDDNGAD